MNHSKRYHEFDSLRAWMMMLGLVLHAAVAYMETPLGELWGFKDAQTNLGFDVLVLFVHTFRMPVFFVMAGFFAALLVKQRGIGSMIRNRARRVFWPLVVGWLVLFPLTIAGFAYSQIGGGLEGALQAVKYAIGPEVLDHIQLLHLWFLLDLLIYYIVAVAITALFRAEFDSGKSRFRERFGRMIAEWHAPLVPAALTLLTLIPMRSGMLETPGTFARPIATLAANGVFFVFGWLLYLSRDSIPLLAIRAGRRLAAACGLFLIHAVAVNQLSKGQDQYARALAVVSLSGSIWLFTFGLTGLFVRYASRPSPLGRYFADASYWFYLVHLPLVAWGAGLLSSLEWPASVKYVVLLGAVVGICFLTYDLLVRPTVIGVFLNGRRYPRLLSSFRSQPSRETTSSQTPSSAAVT